MVWRYFRKFSAHLANLSPTINYWGNGKRAWNIKILFSLDENVYIVSQPVVNELTVESFSWIFKEKKYVNLKYLHILLSLQHLNYKVVFLKNLAHSKESVRGKFILF